MEIADVRKRVLETVARAKAAAKARRARNEQAAAEYPRFLEAVAVPICRQLVNVLRSEGHRWTLATPSGGIRLDSDRSSDEFLQMSLDATSDPPSVVCRTRRRQGGRILESERPMNESGSIAELTEDEVLRFLLVEFEPFVDR